MPETVPGIQFDNDGVCLFCREFTPFSPDGEDKLKELVRNSRNAGSEYDCIVPLSGGRDSSYVLFYAVKKLGMKALAVNFNNEFQIEQAKKNIETTCAALDTELLSIRSGNDSMHKIVRNGLLSVEPFWNPNLCRGCSYGYRSVVYRTAEEKNIPLILWGESEAESTSRITSVINANLNTAPKWKKLLNPYFFLCELEAYKQQKEFHVDGNPAFIRTDPELKNPAVIQVKVYNYIEWDRAVIKDAIASLGWKKPEGHISTWRSDCSLHKYVNYCYWKTLGCTKDCLGYCNMINSGKMNRDEALKQEEFMIEKITDNLTDFLQNEFGFSETIIRKLCPDYNV